MPQTLFNAALACLGILLLSAPVGLAEPRQMPHSPTPWAAVTSSDKVKSLLEPRLFNAACCKTCRKGKACGDSCISKSKSCRKGPGCACDG